MFRGLLPPLGRLLVLAVLAAVLAAASALWCRDLPLWTDARAISWEEAAALGLRAIWIDARPAERFAAAHAPGAINLNERAWDAGIERFLAAWQPGQVIVIYCDSGGCRTGHHVAAHLERDLQTPTRVLTGGWETVRRHAGALP